MDTGPGTSHGGEARRSEMRDGFVKIKPKPRIRIRVPAGRIRAPPSSSWRPSWAVDLQALERGRDDGEG